MLTVTFTDFRRRASEMVDAVEHGETVLLLRHGRPVAEVRPVAPPVTQEPAWRRPRERLVVSGVSLSETVIMEREEREVAVCGR